MTEKCEKNIQQIVQRQSEGNDQEEYLKRNNIPEDLYKYKEHGVYIRLRADFMKYERSNNYFYQKKKE